MELLKRFPSKLREFRKREAKTAAESALRDIPSLQSGRPRKDVIAREAIELKQKGQSYAKIANELNRRYGADTTNKEAVRSLIRSRLTTTPRRKAGR